MFLVYVPGVVLLGQFWVVLFFCVVLSFVSVLFWVICSVVLYFCFFLLDLLFWVNYILLGFGGLLSKA